MSRQVIKRDFFYDGQQVSETDLNVEQSAWVDTIANDVDLLAASGVEKEFSAQRVLFDSNAVPVSIAQLITAANIDGMPLYETDAFNQIVFTQPSDAVEGVQLEVEISDSSLIGSKLTRVYLFGESLDGAFIQESFVFTTNESQISHNYFTKVLAIMTQDFRGNHNTLVDGYACINYGGRLRVLEATSMYVFSDTVTASQTIEPTMDYVHFKPSNTAKTLDDLLIAIAAVDSKSVADLNINTTTPKTRLLPSNNSGLIIGEKFQATSNNIQKVSILLAVQYNTGYDWSGDLTVGIRPLQKTNQCPLDVTPAAMIDFDPAPSALAEISFSQADLLANGIILDGYAKAVDVVFTQTTLASPILSQIIPGDYYILTITRGSVGTGTIVIPEATNSVINSSNMFMSVFSANQWVDVPESDMWFKVYSDTLAITNGTAIDSGVQITSPKVVVNPLTGANESYVETGHNFIDTAEDNYVIVQKINQYSDSISHPVTGNPQFTRIADVPSFSVVAESTVTTLIDAQSNPIILGVAKDNNPNSFATITGSTVYPGLATANTFTILAPSTDLILNNLVGSILTPNTSKSSLTYRVVKQEVFTDAYGDVNGDGAIDTADVVLASALDGYSKLFDDIYPITPADQRAAIIAGTVTMPQIVRADVDGNGYVDAVDAQAIQNYITIHSAFPVGSEFRRVVLTVESVMDPIHNSPNIIGADSSLVALSFTPITYSITFVPSWKSEGIVVSDLRRFVLKSFTSIADSDLIAVVPNGGKNVTLIPGDILLGGDILDVNANPYPIDLEVVELVIELPEGSTQGELDIFNNFIRGKLAFSDGTLVGLGALANNQVKIAASIQSVVKDFAPGQYTDGYDYNDGTYHINETVAILYTQASGVLRIRANNIRNLVIRPELRTKIVLSVYLKKAGFENADQTISSQVVANLITPI